MKLTLKAIRVNNNWSQEEAATKFGVSVATLQNYEAYKTYPDVPIINNIITATGLNYDDIIFLPPYNAKSVLDNQEESIEE